MSTPTGFSDIGHSLSVVACGLGPKSMKVKQCRHLPLWGGQRLLVCCAWAYQGVIRPSPPALALVEHVMDRWNDLVRCVRDPTIPASTNLLEVWFGRFKPRARLARGLKTPHGAQAFLNLLAGNLA